MEWLNYEINKEWPNILPIQPNLNIVLHNAMYKKSFYLDQLLVSQQKVLLSCIATETALQK